MRRRIIDTMNVTSTPATDARTRRGLDALVAELRSVTSLGADPATTAERVAGVLLSQDPTVDLLTPAERQGSSEGYTRHTLHTESTFSVLAVVWRPGQATEIHDHLVWCSFLVLQGSETESLYDIVGDRLVEIGKRERPTGSVSGVAPPDDIHRVRNTGDVVAITLHVYGADLGAGSSVRRTYELNEMP